MRELRRAYFKKVDDKYELYDAEKDFEMAFEDLGDPVLYQALVEEAMERHLHDHPTDEANRIEVDAVFTVDRATETVVAKEPIIDVFNGDVMTKWDLVTGEKFTFDKHAEKLLPYDVYTKDVDGRTGIFDRKTNKEIVCAYHPNHFRDRAGREHRDVTHLEASGWEGKRTIWVDGTTLKWDQ